MASPTGISFGNYVLIERLAAGGMAEVFKAKKLGAAGFEKICAVKRILPTFSDEKAFVDMFIDEARLASQLTHANIINVDDFGFEQGQFFLAMEYIAGVDLSKFIKLMAARGAKIPVEVAVFVMAEIANGLSYAHGKSDESGQPLGLVHRDVSPQNILLSFAGSVKLADFGIAKAKRKLHVTAIGAVVGKFRYMSPEQVVGQDLDGRSDVFSAGTVLWELLAGRALFDGEGASALEQIKTLTVPPPSQHNREVTPALDHIVQRSLARSPEERYGSAAEMGRSLRQFLHGLAPGYASDDLATFIGRVVPPPALAARVVTDPTPPAPVPGTLGLEVTVAQGTPRSGASGGAGAPSTHVLEAALERELGARSPTGGYAASRAADLAVDRPSAGTFAGSLGGPAAESDGRSGPKELGVPHRLGTEERSGPRSLGGSGSGAGSAPGRGFGGVSLDLGREDGPRYPPTRSRSGAVAGWLLFCLALGGGGYFGWTRYKDKLMALVGPEAAPADGGAGSGGGPGVKPREAGPRKPEMKPPVVADQPSAPAAINRPKAVWSADEIQTRRSQLLAAKPLARLLGAPGTSPSPAALQDRGLLALLEALSVAIGAQRLDARGLAVAEPVPAALATRLRAKKLLKEADGAIELFRQGGGLVPEELAAVARLVAQTKQPFVATGPGRPGHDLAALLGYLMPQDAAAQETVLRARTLGASFGDPARLGAGERWLNPQLISRPEALARLIQLSPTLPLSQAVQRYEAARPRGSQISLPGDLKLTLLEARGPKPGQKGTLTLKLRAQNVGTLPAAPPWAAFRLQGAGEPRAPQKTPASTQLAPGAMSEASVGFALLADDLTLVLTVPGGKEPFTLRVASAPHGDLLAGSGGDDDDYFR